MAGHGHNATGKWLPLIDYAMKKGVSLSTLRRHIKANKLQFKIDGGKYLIWDEEKKLVEDASHRPLESELTKLTYDLKKAHEEIAELKTLIAFYEEKIPQQRFNN